jgi:hypothetical protein
MTFFKVSAPVNPPPNFSFRTSTSESIVGVFGVSTLVLSFLEVFTETGINVFLIQKKDEHMLADMLH